MKRTIFFGLSLFLCSLFIFAKIPKGELMLETRATKTIEDNFAKDTSAFKGYNFDSKTPTERLFFGDYNAPFEFYVTPSFEGAYGFRIFRNPVNFSWMFEMKRVLNWDEVDKKIQQEFPHQIIQVALSQGLDGEAWRQMNRTIWAKQAEESAKLYEVKTVSFPIADSLARKLYANVFIALATAPPEIKGQGVRDGILVTFRCVVDDQVWTLNYHEPDEGDFLKLTDICTQMVNDAEAGNFDTAKYLEMLNQ